MSLREKTVLAVKWNLLATVLSSIFGLISLWLLSHLLTTQDYGIISAALIISTFITVLLDFGISNSIIRSKELERIELSSLYVINITLGVIACLIALIFSQQIAGLFKADDMLATQIKIMSIGFVISSFGLQAKALLTREMNFGAIAKITIASTFINFVSVVLLAWIYRSPWCIALAFLISATANTFLSTYAARPLRTYDLQFRFSAVKKHFRYGIQLVIDSMINQISINTYPVLMSRLISLSAIGGYNIAYSISIGLFEKLNPVLSHTLFPALAKIGGDDTKLRLALLKITTYSAMINFPMLLGMMIIAPSLVDVFFDAKWQFIVPIVQVLCAAGAIRSLDTPVISVLLVKAQMYRNLYLGVAKLIVGIPLTWLLGYKAGLIGIVYGFLIIQVMNAICGYFFLLRPSIGVKGIDYLKSILIPSFHVAPMVLGGWVARYYFTPFSEILSMIAVASTCVLIYITTIYFSPANVIREFKELVTSNLIRKITKQ